MFGSVFRSCLRLIGFLIGFVVVAYLLLVILPPIIYGFTEYVKLPLEYLLGVVGSGLAFYLGVIYKISRPKGKEPTKKGKPARKKQRGSFVSGMPVIPDATVFTGKKAKPYLLSGPDAKPPSEEESKTTQHIAEDVPISSSKSSQYPYQVRQLSSSEIIQHYSDEKLVEYNGGKILQVLTDHVLSGLTENQMRFIEVSGVFKLPLEIEPIKERILSQVKSLRRNADYYESSIWRIEGFDRKSHTMRFVKVKYSEYIVTNLASELGIVIQDSPLLYLLESGKKLRRLETSSPANNLGVGAMIITSDDYTFFQLRSRKTMTYPDMLGPSASGLMNVSPEPKSAPNPFSAMRTEIQEELGIEASEITELRYVGLTRELISAGKPEMFFIARVSLNLSEILKRFDEGPRDARETEVLNELVVSQIKQPLPEGNMSLAAKIGLFFLFHYVKVHDAYRQSRS